MLKCSASLEMSSRGLPSNSTCILKAEPGKLDINLEACRAIQHAFSKSDSTCILKAEPGKLDIKRRKPGILFIRLPIVSLLKLAIMT